MDKLTLISLALGAVGAVLSIAILFFSPILNTSRLVSGTVSRISIFLTISVALISAGVGLLGGLGIGIESAPTPTVNTAIPPPVLPTPMERKTLTLGQINRTVSPNFNSLGGNEQRFVDRFPAPPGYRVVEAKLLVRNASRESYTLTVLPDAVLIDYAIRAGSVIDQYRGWLDAEVVATIERNP